eukprot:7331482-Prymnesium_polylepis.1
MDPTAPLAITLMWNSSADLDLRCTPPSGKQIYYGAKEHSGGKLDIDMNAGGNHSDTPVENIVFTAPAPGTYRVEVTQADGAYKCYVRANGQYREFCGSRRGPVCTFDYTGSSVTFR